MTDPDKQGQPVDPEDPSRTTIAPLPPVRRNQVALFFREAGSAAVRQIGLGLLDGLESNEFWHQGKYVIERTLGLGAMGVVYLARETTSAERVVLKLMRRPGGSDVQGYLDRFRREIYALRSIEHRGIARFLDAGVEQRGEESIPWFATEYRAGSQLSDWVRDRPLIPLRWSLECAAALGQAAGHAHSLGFVHRDIKPENTIVERNQQDVFLIDFGLVKILLGQESYLESSSSSLLGTIAFMSPEQVSGSDVGPRADVYSLGGLLQWLLTGVPANPIVPGMPLQDLASAVFNPPPCFDGWPQLDHELEAICHRAQAQRPEERYPDGTQFAQAVQDYLERHDRGRRHLLRVLDPAGQPDRLLDGRARIEGAEFVPLLEGYAVLAAPGVRVELNGQPVRDKPLQHGDRVRVRDISLVYRRDP